MAWVKAEIVLPETSPDLKFVRTESLILKFTFQETKSGEIDMVTPLPLKLTQPGIIIGI